MDAIDRSAVERLAADPDALREACEERLMSAWAGVGSIPSYPTSTENAAALLRVRGYDVTPTILAGWAAAPNMIPEIVHANGRVGWTATSIVNAMSHAENQRRWIPLHPEHLGKLTDVEAAEAQAVALGSTVFDELDSVDCRSIVGVLVSAREHQDRIVIGAALIAKLRHLGVLEK